MNSELFSNEELLDIITQMSKLRRAEHKASVVVNTGWVVLCLLFILAAPLSVYFGDAGSYQRGFWCFYAVVVVLGVNAALLCRKSTILLRIMNGKPTEPVPVPEASAEELLNDAVRQLESCLKAAEEYEEYEEAAKLRDIIAVLIAQRTHV